MERKNAFHSPFFSDVSQHSELVTVPPRTTHAHGVADVSLRLHKPLHILFRALHCLPERQCNREKARWVLFLPIEATPSGCRPNARCLKEIRRTYQKNTLRRKHKKSAHKDSKSASARKNPMRKKPICGKPLAKTEKICYNVLRVPVIRLYRGACFTFMQGCCIAVQQPAFFVCISIIPQIKAFVNTF